MRASEEIIIVLGKSQGSGPAPPSAPVLLENSESAGLVSLTWDIDNTVAAGDTLIRQAQVSGGNWSSLVDNTNHIITSGEDTANAITASLTLTNGTYDVRGYVLSATTGKTSTASNVLTITISDAYQGPGDIIGTAFAFYSPARAYSSAFASSGAAIMDIVDSAGANAATINILSSGYVDLTTLNAWITAHGTAKVTKLYDQSGNARHVTQATLANMPVITQSALNSLPGVTFAAGSQVLLSANVTQTAPISFSTVAKRTVVNNAAFVGSNTNPGGITGNGSANLWQLQGNPTAFTASATDSVYHAAQALLNGTTSSLSIDGSTTAGSAGTASGYSAAAISLGRANGGSLTGTIMEAMLWAGDKSTSFSSLNSNQHGTNGYNF